MSGTPPTRVGPYEVLREIGRGGMGVVYLARDTKLDRDVAIKALPEALAGDTERLARFEREAKLLASLHHSHIAGVYGLEEQDEARFLILEYVQGETLDAMIKHGPLMVDDALSIARQ
ncbi:MAG: protein kinase, partial [Planctomycetota bacterium]|nr:protein kinase [Planctomycetota bacterium]